MALPMTEGSGTVAHDISGRGNDGVFNGAISWQGGPSGWVVTGFSAGATTTTWIDCGADAGMNPTGPYTLAAWIFLSIGATGQNWFLCRDDNVAGRAYALGVNGSANQLQLQINGTPTLTGGLLVSAVAWHHIAVVGDPNVGYIGYVDAVQSNTAAWTAPNVTTGHTTVGKRTFAAFQDGIFGSMDFPMIYNRALSQSEIALLVRDTWSMMRLSAVGKAKPVSAPVVSSGGRFDMGSPYGLGYTRRRKRRG